MPTPVVPLVEKIPRSSRDRWFAFLSAAIVFLSVMGVRAQTRYGYVEVKDVAAPVVPREFRAAWVATVGNIDWPSKPGLPVTQQKAEMIAILNRLQQLKMNAIILQVRPTADALYPSKNEPWSWYLTGNMGQPPNPYYDPIAFTIVEARKRGIEFHAWFNPFRARHPSCKGKVSASHITRKRPDLVRRYGSLEWLDPGHPEVQSHSLNVILDVMKRYDVDGIHIDDYFYPYPEKTRGGKLMPFPDQSTYARYRRLGGKLSVSDWRRDNVNRFVKRLYLSIKKTKPWVKFGISPFGIWRPGYPKQIKGMDAYETLYANALLWWQKGWVDYFAPQLYWPIDSPGQSFPVLLNWWSAQNLRNRHLWPGISVWGTKMDRNPREVVNQIAATRRQPKVHGQVIYGMNGLLTNSLGIASLLAKHSYNVDVLPPAMPWLGRKQPPKPRMSFGLDLAAKLAGFHWKIASTKPARHWVLQQKIKGKWKSKVLPGTQKTFFIRGELVPQLPEYIAISAVDRNGIQGPPIVARKSVTVGAPVRKTK